MQTNIDKENTVILSLPDLAHSRFYKSGRPIYAKKDFFEAGYNQSIHLHDFPQIWFCVSGYATHIVGNDSLEMKSGDVVTVPAGRPHAFRVLEDGEFFSLSIPLDIFLRNETVDIAQLSFYCLLPAFADEVSDKL
ncbi:MAG: cupin domain-containing protein, partial [Clostridia bacterium]|nr:cupin domain-containing protein [Clostridia bacterium]